MFPDILNYRKILEENKKGFQFLSSFKYKIIFNKMENLAIVSILVTSLN